MTYENDWWWVETGALAIWEFGALQLVALARFATNRGTSIGEPVLDWSDPILWLTMLFLVGAVAVGLNGWIKARKWIPEIGSGNEIADHLQQTQRWCRINFRETEGGLYMNHIDDPRQLR